MPDLSTQLYGESAETTATLYNAYTPAGWTSGATGCEWILFADSPSYNQLAITLVVPAGAQQVEFALPQEAPPVPPIDQGFVVAFDPALISAATLAEISVQGTEWSCGVVSVELPFGPSSTGAALFVYPSGLPVTVLPGDTCTITLGGVALSGEEVVARPAALLASNVAALGAAGVIAPLCVSLWTFCPTLPLDGPAVSPCPPTVTFVDPLYTVPFPGTPVPDKTYTNATVGLQPYEVTATIWFSDGTDPPNPTANALEVTVDFGPSMPMAGGGAWLGFFYSAPATDADTTVPSPMAQQVALTTAASAAEAHVSASGAMSAVSQKGAESGIPIWEITIPTGSGSTTGTLSLTNVLVTKAQPGGTPLVLFYGFSGVANGQIWCATAQLTKVAPRTQVVFFAAYDQPTPSVWPLAQVGVYWVTYAAQGTAIAPGAVDETVLSGTAVLAAGTSWATPDVVCEPAAKNADPSALTLMVADSHLSPAALQSVSFEFGAPSATFGAWTATLSPSVLGPVQTVYLIPLTATNASTATLTDEGGEEVALPALETTSAVSDLLVSRTEEGITGHSYTFVVHGASPAPGPAAPAIVQQVVAPLLYAEGLSRLQWIVYACAGLADIGTWSPVTGLTTIAGNDSATLTLESASPAAHFDLITLAGGASVAAMGTQSDTTSGIAWPIVDLSSSTPTLLDPPVSLAADAGNGNVSYISPVVPGSGAGPGSDLPLAYLAGASPSGTLAVGALGSSFVTGTFDQSGLFGTLVNAARLRGYGAGTDAASLEVAALSLSTTWNESTLLLSGATTVIQDVIDFGVNPQLSLLHALVYSTSPAGTSATLTTYDFTGTPQASSATISVQADTFCTGLDVGRVTGMTYFFALTAEGYACMYAYYDATSASWTIGPSALFILPAGQVPIGLAVVEGLPT